MVSPPQESPPPHGRSMSLALLELCAAFGTLHGFVINKIIQWMGYHDFSELKEGKAVDVL